MKAWKFAGKGTFIYWKRAISPIKSNNKATTLAPVETTTGIMIVAMVEACAATDTTVATVSIAVNVSESSLSQVGPVQFGQLIGQPK